MIRYTEKEGAYEQTMELHEDHVDLIGHRRFGVHWSQTVPLSGLNSKPARVSSRYRPYSRHAVFVFISFLLIMMIVGLLDNFIHLPPITGTVLFAPLCAWLVVVLALLFISRRVELAIFATTTATVALTVTCRYSDDHEAFEAFVAAVSEQIRQKATT
ncbi:MAG: hypothetical protein WB973_10880 [Thermoanaerobaculia bacterium]